VYTGRQRDSVVDMCVEPSGAVPCTVPSTGVRQSGSAKARVSGRASDVSGLYMLTQHRHENSSLTLVGIDTDRVDASTCCKAYQRPS
jgi:hypothetical protein